jgi:predicted MPP superfamily phosphohydrolase
MMPVFVIIILIIQAILAFAHFVLYKTLVSVFTLNNPNTLIFLKIILITLSVSFVVVSLLTFRYYNSVLSIFYTISAAWLGFLFYLFLASVCYWLVVSLGSHFFTSINILLLGKILVSVALLVGVYGVAQAYNAVVTDIKISLSNMPQEWEGKKAVWISDVHLGDVHGISAIEKLFQKVRNLHPDIIFIGGDLFDSSNFPVETAVMPLASLRAPLGVYFISGNHEEFTNKSKYLNVIKKAGVIILDNEAVNIEGVKIIGVGYKDTVKRIDYENLLKSLTTDKSKPIILLKHSPSDLDIALQNGVDFQISGHTHRAQMWPFNYITKLVYKGFDYGLRNFAAMVVYTSSGVGTWGPPLRIGSPSEIVLIEFQSSFGNTFNKPDSVLQTPLDKTLERVTKKSFGIKISPLNSPVQPERFFGYHTGVDFEILTGEEDQAVKISALCAGSVLLKKWAAGYGGVLVQSCNLDNEAVTIIYGHLKLASIVAKIGDNLSIGKIIGVLGNGYSIETDFERKHLHLGIHKGSAVDIQGYVANVKDLQNWMDVFKYLR